MKTGQKIRVSILVLLFLCGGAYLGITYYYMDGFSFGTWINGIYCTGKSVEEVNEELLLQLPAPELTVTYPINEGEEAKEADRKSSHFVLDKEILQADYTRALQRLLQEQRPLLWARNLFLPPGGYVLKPAITLTQDGAAQFEKQFLSDKVVQAELNRKAVISLKTEGEKGLWLYDGKKNRFDAKKAFIECQAAIEAGKESILLSENCYYDESLNEAEKEKETLYQELQAFLDFEIVYDMGAEKVRFDKKALTELLSVEEGGEFEVSRNETGSFYWDEEKVKAAVETLAGHYDTYGKPREFTMTGGGTVTIEKGNYGTELDQKAEMKWLLAALTERKDAVRVPVYLREAYVRGENDIGNTYIEVNMTKQKLWFYLDGKIEIETPIVTGDMLLRRATPEGVYYVYGKNKNCILRGPGYASHVNYWMPVNRGIGLHDALWREEFGGDIYKKEGSHGCVNLPLEAAQKLYGLVEIGMPTVMYYEE